MKHPNPTDLEMAVSMSGLGALRPDGQAAPRLVIRGESTTDTPYIDLESQTNQIAFVDYLSFSFKDHNPNKDRFPLRDIILELFNIPLESCQHLKGGRLGYEHCISFGGFGSLSYGGESQRNTIYVQISGQGCKQISDWLGVYTWGVSNDVKITRLDVAHDDTNGTELSIARAIQWYEEGLFCTNGRPPKRHLHSDFDDGDGKTFEIGKRGNSKFTRIYEKGKQLGYHASPWVRAEVEFLAKDQHIAWEAILNPVHFLTGAYPAFAHLSETQSRFDRINREANLSLEKAIEWGRTSCGNLINALCLLHNEDYQKVITLLRRNEIPKSLTHYFKCLPSVEG